MLAQIIIAILALSVLILVHELGHFLAAKLMGVWVEEFGIGLPPRLKGKKIGKTLFSLNALPLGGFVKLHGETHDDEVKKPKQAFTNKNAWQRMTISVAGVFMNFVLAMLAFSLVFWIVGIGKGVKVIEISQSSPAQEIGLQGGDIITSVGGNPVESTDDFGDLVKKNQSSSTQVTFQREEEGEVVSLTKEADLSDRSETDGILGVLYTSKEIVKPPVLKRPFIYTYLGLKETVKWTGRIAQGISQIASQAASGKKPEGVAGPLAVTATIAEISRFGLVPLAEFTAIISINLALINLVPFPPLDGSRVLFILLEKVIGKDRVVKFESKAHVVGMALLLLLVLGLTLTEIPKLIAAGSLSNFVETLFSQ